MMPPEPDLQRLRRAALQIFAAALKEVDAGDALRKKIRRDGPHLTVFDTAYKLETVDPPVYAVAIGKAAASMAAALDGILGSRLTEGIVAAPSQVGESPHSLPQQLLSAGRAPDDAAKTEQFREPSRRAVRQGVKHPAQRSSLLSSRWKVFAGGHPLPNQESLDAARSAINLLRRADMERGLVLFLISGGGSAAFELPRDGRITLEDLRKANRDLVSCGATIAEINSVRRAISAVKGGRLSALAPHARQISLIISDTNPGEESTVASGPTFAPPSHQPEPRDVISRYRLEKSLPASILRAVGESAVEGRKTSSIADINHHLVLDNWSAIEAARRAATGEGFIVDIAPDIIEQPIGDGCVELLSRLDAGTDENKGEVFCLISGGEFACPVYGDGTGGRNAETVLRCALAVDERRQRAAGDKSMEAHAVILSAGTDGIDGNSPAAGTIADETTIERARARGLSAHESLERSDAYTFFHAVGDAILTGTTGTNVRDLRIMISQSTGRPHKAVSPKH
jgi:glycerate 2-kinase